MRMKYVYLGLAVLGFVLTVSQLIPFVQMNGSNIMLMFEELFSSNATSFFGFDLLVTAVAGLVFMIVDGRRNKVRHLWVPVISVFMVGIALGFPLYLYMRENHLEKKTR